MNPHDEWLEECPCKNCDVGLTCAKECRDYVKWENEEPPCEVIDCEFCKYHHDPCMWDLFEDNE